MCRRCADWRAARASPRRSVWTAAPCSRLLKAVLEPAMTGPSGGREARSISRSIPWATCWRSPLHRPIEGDREQVAALAAQVQQVTGNTVEFAFVDQGYTGPNAAAAAQEHGIRLEVVKHPMAKRGFVLLPRRWVVQRSFAWAARLRRLARDYERLPDTLKGLHYIAFAILMTARLVSIAAQSS